ISKEDLRMKRLSLIFAFLISLMVMGQYASAELSDGDLHFTPMIGYMDPRDGDADGGFAWGAEVSYQWDFHHELAIGFLAAKHDATGTVPVSSHATSLIGTFGYNYHFNSNRNGNFYVGLDVAPHKIKYGGTKWNKAGLNVSVGYEWKSLWVTEIGYLFAGTDDQGDPAATDDVQMGGLTVLFGYKL
ncbi:MAG: hypothetical protein ABIH66_14135, partial [bacterium]